MGGVNWKSWPRTPTWWTNVCTCTDVVLILRSCCCLSILFQSASNSLLKSSFRNPNFLVFELSTPDFQPFGTMTSILAPGSPPSFLIFSELNSAILWCPTEVLIAKYFVAVILINYLNFICFRFVLIRHWLHTNLSTHFDWVVWDLFPDDYAADLVFVLLSFLRPLRTTPRCPRDSIEGVWNLLLKFINLFCPISLDKFSPEC